MPEHQVVKTDAAPAAIGPYSQAIRSGDLLFCSGVVGLDPATGELAAANVTAQTRRALDNLAAVLDAGGATFASIIKTTIFLKDMADFATVNALYAERFTGAFPARSTVEVARLPRDARVEIEAIARVG